jgi:hypothetical protein
MPEAPTPRPLIPAPQKPQPMRMQSNNPEGGVPQSNTSGTTGKGSERRSSPEGESASPSEVKTPKPSELSPKEIARHQKLSDRTIEKAKVGKVQEASNYHGRLGREKELGILSNPDAVYISAGKSGRFIYRKGNDIVITEGGSKNGQIVTSYGPSGPRGESGATALGTGKPTDPGAPITHEMIVNGEIPTPKGETLAPAEMIRGKLEGAGEP